MPRSVRADRSFEQLAAWRRAAPRRPARATLAPLLLPALQVVGSAASGFDCGGDVSTFIAEQQEWCCQTQGVACRSTTSQYDCDDGYAQWELGWGVGKKTWCCVHEAKGCLPTATSTTTLPYDCQLGYTDWQVSWGFAKKAWCCSNEGRGCQTTRTATTTLPYDCNLKDEDWSSGWGFAKKSWCCANTGRGCAEVPTTTTTATRTPAPPPYDCDGGAVSEETWGVQHKAWCCQHRRRGCPTTMPPTTTPIVASTLATRPPAAQSAAMPATTSAILASRSASTSSSSALYACDGISMWWTEQERDWCCQTQSKGCTTTRTAPESYDCSTGAGVSRRAPSTWGAAQRRWCCEAAQIGCAVGATSQSAAPLASGALTNEVKLMMSTPPATGDLTTKTQLQTSTPQPPGDLTTDAHLQTSTSPAPGILVMSCAMNCYGAGAQEVALGRAGGAEFVAGLTLQQCREACIDTEKCEGVSYNGEVSPTMCFGKKNIHTSFCQPGDGFETRIVGARPWGKCALMGDPHILPFDRPYGPTLEQIRPGEYYLVKSPRLEIHGRFGYTERFPEASSTLGVAAAGDALGGHRLVVEYIGPDRGYKGFRAKWDDELILTEMPSKYTSHDNVLTAVIGEMDPSDFHRDARHTIGGVAGLMPSYLFELGEELKIFVLIGPDNCNVIIEAKKLPGEQDGYCGNFNCIGDDDGLEELRARNVAGPIVDHHSLFSPLSAAAAQAPGDELEGKRLADLVLEACNETLKQLAAERCGQLRGAAAREDCVYDACVAGSVGAADEDVSTAALGEGYSPSAAGAAWGAGASRLISRKYSFAPSIGLVADQGSLLLVGALLFLLGGIPTLLFLSPLRRHDPETARNLLRYEALPLAEELPLEDGMEEAMPVQRMGL